MRRQAIERLLPTAYQRTAAAPGVLAALLDAMEAMHAPSEEILARVDDLFAPYRCPDRMVDFLLSWVALDHALGSPAASPSIPVGRLRDLLSVGAWIAQHRGTARGLRAIVALAVGTPVEIEEPADRPFHIVVRLPASAGTAVALVRRIVEAEKPAAVTAEIVVPTAGPALAAAAAEEGPRTAAEGGPRT